MPYIFLPDSSVMVNGKILELINEGALNDYKPVALSYLKQPTKTEIALSRIVLAEIENQANRNKAIGTVGLEVIQELYRLNKAKKITIQIVGDRPTLEQIKLVQGGELDALIRKDAFECGAILLTGDNIQASMASIEGIDVFYSTSFVPEVTKCDSKTIPNWENYFDNHTMSVHLKGHSRPMAKKGKPGEWRLEILSNDVMEPHIIEEIAARIYSEAKGDEGTFIEKDEGGVQVIQRHRYRIVICRPPFANTIEITFVRPLVNLTIADYKLPKKMLDRLEIAEGILVAGSPGAGKSTFISALTEFYRQKNKIIKTLESVRDLVVNPEVTQYSPLLGDMEKTADILLLVRPDFTIFDEVRVEADFKIFGDMRLAGVGLVGVVHASKAVDAIQRFIRRIELGVIPNVIDTIIFIRNGRVEDVLSTQMTVKKPTGFTDRDLSRPVIEVRDFLRGDLLYEIYAFGQDVVVAPVGNPDRKRFHQDTSTRPLSKSEKRRKAKMDMLNQFADLEENENDDGNDDNEENISDEKNQVGESENVFGEDLQEYPSEFPKSGYLEVFLSRRAKSIVLTVGARYANEYITFQTDEGELLSGTLNKQGELTIKRSSPIFAKLERMMRKNRPVYASPK